MGYGRPLEKILDDGLKLVQGREILPATGCWIRRADYGASGWDILLPGANITCDLVVGDHFSIMKKPGVLELGDKMAIPVSY